MSGGRFCCLFPGLDGREAESGGWGPVGRAPGWGSLRVRWCRVRAGVKEGCQEDAPMRHSRATTPFVVENGLRPQTLHVPNDKNRHLDYIR